MPQVSPLASVAATRAVLETYGLATKHALGQHFLISDGIVGKILSTAEVASDDVVLEVGPGIGTMTVALLDRSRAVIAVERDADLPAVLAETCAGHGAPGAFTLLQKDALDLAAEDFTGTEPNKFVANLPYAVAATLVLDYFERFPSIMQATVMVQKEVADRMSAAPGSKEYGAYTVKLGLHAKKRARFAVGRGNFFPPPRVDSAVIRLDRICPTYQGSDLTQRQLSACTLVADASFASRRKTILNSSRTYFRSLGAAGTAVADCFPGVLEEAGIDAGRRGETLSQEEFIRLGCLLASHDVDWQ
ncbi:MAG: 16S rRNA (adenine(1518)-N(6)/adenine(1519)-N(6))-dimethyltransferase RsmA [Eggerthellaceae bacterium]|jgi:16S rRNA (adenine1518-N6/adenine1519-N6)-dimethyltransferase